MSHRAAVVLGTLSITLALAACRKPEGPADTGAPVAPPPSSAPASVPAEPRAPEAAIPATTTATVGPGDVARANDFALRAFRAVSAQHAGANVLVSPPSLRLALGMVLLGARGETARELGTTLGLDADPQAVVHEARAESAAWSSVGGPGITLSVANRLWGERTLTLDPGFVSRSRAGFGAGLEQLDFAHAFEPARATINGWVKTETQDKIPELLPAGSLSALTRLVVTNAVYFDGKWTTPFDPQDTHPGSFFVAGKKEVQVPLMRRTGKMKLLRSKDAALVELPYGGGAMSMVIVLPDARAGLDTLELDAALLDALTTADVAPKVQLVLPRFEFSHGGSVKKALQALGMRRAFDPAAAELDGIAERAELSVSDVFHKTFVRVDEAGTEAAAATGAVIATRAAAAPPPSVIVDHPFLFLLRETKTQRVLFVGRVEDPRT